MRFDPGFSGVKGEMPWDSQNIIHTVNCVMPEWDLSTVIKSSSYLKKNKP